MESNWAVENLQTIRTLMERSALYRRALAPMMLATGAVGLIAAGIGLSLKLQSARSFVCFWFTVSFVALGLSFLLVRRQALKEKEAIWSPPARRVVQALFPNLFLGAVIGLVFAHTNGPFANLPALWITLYGCAIHAAGFFMPRGIRLFGWIFLIAGAGLLAWPVAGGGIEFGISPDAVMGVFFGGGHLAYGIYLYFTEPRNNAA